MKHNIAKYYAYAIFMALSFAFVPFFALFMVSRGMTFTDIGISTGYYYALFLIVELPTGVIADKLGRKATLALAGIFKVIALLILLNSFSLPGFILGETFFALARSFASGADSAFLYETLAFHNNQSDYKKIEGRHNTYRGLALTLGSIIGGFLALRSVESVYLFASFMALIAFFISLTFKETATITKNTARSIKENIRHLTESLKAVKRNKKMMWIIGYSSLIFLTLRASTISLQQPLLIHAGLPAHYFGFFDAIVALGASVIAWYAHRIEAKIGVRGITLFMPLLAILIFLGVTVTLMVLPLIALAIFALILINWGLYDPVFRDYLNIEVKEPDKRATILSVESLVSRVIFAIVMVVMGFILDMQNGIQLSFITLAFITTLGMLLLAYLKRRWKIA